MILVFSISFMTSQGFLFLSLFCFLFLFLGGRDEFRSLGVRIPDTQQNQMLQVFKFIIAIFSIILEDFLISTCLLSLKNLVVISCLSDDKSLVKITREIEKSLKVNDLIFDFYPFFYYLMKINSFK